MNYQTYRESWKNTYLGKLPYAPLNVDIELASICNLRCIMCHQNNDKEINLGVMDISLAKKIIDQCAKYDIPAIKFNWRGEATLHPNLPELIYYAKSKGILDIILNTNGNFKNIHELLLSGVDFIIFSVDATTEETYKKIRVGGDFSLLQNNIKQALSFFIEYGRPRLKVQFVEQDINRHEVQNFISTWKDKLEIRVSQATDRTGNTSTLRRKFCPQPFQRLTIGYDGKIMPCCVDSYEQYILGDANTDDLLAIWQGEKINVLREKSRQVAYTDFEPCASCYCMDSYIPEAPIKL